MSVSIWNGSGYTPMYTSTVTLIANLKNSAAYSFTTLSSSSELANIYTRLFVQPTMKKHAAAYLGNDSFVGSVSSEVLPETNIFTVSVTTSSPEMSYKELCAILEVYPEISETIFTDAVLEIMRHPNLPTAPSNHISDSNRTIAVLCSALAVLALIVYLSITRDTVKDENSFHHLIESPLFGTISHENQQILLKDRLLKKKSALLITNSFASFRFTENYHKLATKLEYLHRTKNIQVVLLTSFAENEGKSTTAANIALSLANRNNRVLLLDMDFKKPALHKIFDMQNTAEKDFAQLLSGSIPPSEFVFSTVSQSNLKAALNKKPYLSYTNWLHTSSVTDIFAWLRSSGQFDFIIIDTPPISAAADIVSISRLADLSLLVVRTDFVYSPVINDAVTFLKENHSHFGGCILNDVHKEFTLLGQLGTDENGYTGRKYRHGYNSYNTYSRYSRHTDNTPQS